MELYVGVAKTPNAMVLAPRGPAGFHAGLRGVGVLCQINSKLFIYILR
jgi:hypothetical protein